MLTLVFDIPGGKLTLWGRLSENYLFNSDTLPLLLPACSPQAPFCVAETGYNPEHLQRHENSFLGRKEIREKKKKVI